MNETGTDIPDTIEPYIVAFQQAIFRVTRERIVVELEKLSRADDAYANMFPFAAAMKTVQNLKFEDLFGS